MVNRLTARLKYKVLKNYIEGKCCLYEWIQSVWDVIVYINHFLGNSANCRKAEITTLSAQWAVLRNHREGRTIAIAD